MIKLIDTASQFEVFVGFKFGAFSIMAIDYVRKRILFNHHGALREYEGQSRFWFEKDT